VKEILTTQMGTDGHRFGQTVAAHEPGRRPALRLKIGERRGKSVGKKIEDRRSKIEDRR
jgi:hypothetical protein